MPEILSETTITELTGRILEKMCVEITSAVKQFAVEHGTVGSMGLLYYYDGEAVDIQLHITNEGEGIGLFDGNDEDEAVEEVESIHELLDTESIVDDSTRLFSYLNRISEDKNGEESPALIIINQLMDETTAWMQQRDWATVAPITEDFTIDFPLEYD